MSVLVPHREGVPLPFPTAISKPYWDGCAAGKLLFQRCDACGRALFDPTPICRWCGSFKLSWEQSAGAGSVYSWSVVWRPAGPEFSAPYAALIVDMDEGFQILANGVGCEPDELYAGQRVAVEFHGIGGGFSLPYFRPIEGVAHA